MASAGTLEVASSASLSLTSQAVRKLLLFVCLFAVCLFPPFYKKRDLFSWHFPLDGSFKGLSGEETDCRGEKAAKCTKSTMKRGVVCFVKLIQF